MKRVALITGVTGQDGAYLSQLLLEKDYRVYGLLRRSTRYPFGNLDYLGVTGGIEYIGGDMTDEASLIRAVRRTDPDEVYNLAAQSFVGTSWDQVAATTQVNALGCLRLLEAVRWHCPTARFYQASTSEMYGNDLGGGKQTASSRFIPRSPYAASKVFAHNMVRIYRESYGLFAVCGILFNHESPLRGLEFVTRKISNNVAKIKLGLADRFGIGDVQSSRDWGFAGDFVEAMWLMVQQEEPEDLVVCTGERYKVLEFLSCAFLHAGIEPWGKHVYRDPQFYRPAELFHLCGDNTRAKEKLGWEPKVGFEELVRMMVDADIARLSGKGT